MKFAEGGYELSIHNYEPTLSRNIYQSNYQRDTIELQCVQLAYYSEFV